MTRCGTEDFKYGWVDVSRPFDLMDLSRSLLSDLDPTYVRKDRTSTMKHPIQKCSEYLGMHQCLVVIDGLQSTKEWDLINDALGLSGGMRSVIVITNEESVAKYCTFAKARDDRVWNLKGLGADHAFEIIAKVRLLTMQEAFNSTTVLVPYSKYTYH
ncbi:hypothetical protein C2845_PM03G29930 [Panicum miliaceum]|uniref:NB-ARC domain-containing protein n=1 Tax=Panicum miliaceum TaxID=4540 RepID=A0A3L6T587_PANMI|nr:hypothetical protein C2845_PM03G29930 [Panicum miliaceum]